MRLKEAERITIDEYSRWGEDWERHWVPIYKSFATTVIELAQIKTGHRVGCFYCCFKGWRKRKCRRYRCSRGHIEHCNGKTQKTRDWKSEL